MTIIKNTQSGSILQVKHTQFTTSNTITVPANTETIFTDLTVNITPIRANSIIKLHAVVFGEYSNSSYTANGMFYFLRNSTKLAHTESAGSRRTGISGPVDNYHSANAASTPESAHLTYFDSGHNTTSQITYKLALSTLYVGTYYLNRCVTDTNNNEYERGVSIISATEIAP